MRVLRGATCLALGLFLMSGCARPSDTTTQNTSAVDDAHGNYVAVANSFLAAAVRELVGDDVKLVALAEPGMCPGHFDLRPSQVRQVQQCQLLLRFDFQQSIDKLLERAGDHVPRIAIVKVSGGLCEPTSLVDASRQVADVLVDVGLLSRAVADQRVAATAERMKSLATWAREQVDAAQLAELRVMTSRHQEAFCRGLGLTVVATFPTADDSIASEIEDAVQQGREGQVDLIVANLPEGRQAADALADRFAAAVVVFGNFPDGKGTDAFDRLVRDNVQLLVKARPE